MKKKRVLSHVPSKGSALVRAEKMIGAVSKVGFQWPDLEGPLAKVEEELRELKYELSRKNPNKQKIAAELSDFLFTICNMAYLLKVPAEKNLHKMLGRFGARFNFVEKQVLRSKRPWKSFSLDELDVFWNEAKRRERTKH